MDVISRRVWFEAMAAVREPLRRLARCWLYCRRRNGTQETFVWERAICGVLSHSGLQCGENRRIGAHIF
jgi:hypothetical protein